MGIGPWLGRRLGRRLGLALRLLFLGLGSTARLVRVLLPVWNPWLELGKQLVRQLGVVRLSLLDEYCLGSELLRLGTGECRPGMVPLWLALALHLWAELVGLELVVGPRGTCAVFTRLCL